MITSGGKDRQVVRQKPQISPDQKPWTRTLRQRFGTSDVKTQGWVDTSQKKTEHMVIESRRVYQISNLVAVDVALNEMFGCLVRGRHIFRPRDGVRRWQIFCTPLPFQLFFWLCLDFLRNVISPDIWLFHKYKEWLVLAPGLHLVKPVIRQPFKRLNFCSANMHLNRQLNPVFKKWLVTSYNSSTSSWFFSFKYINGWQMKRKWWLLSCCDWHLFILLAMIWNTNFTINTMFFFCCFFLTDCIYHMQKQSWWVWPLPEYHMARWFTVFLMRMKIMQLVQYFMAFTLSRSQFKWTLMRDFGATG